MKILITSKSSISYPYKSILKAGMGSKAYLYIYIHSHPQIDGKVNRHQISRDLLFHLFGDDYNIYIYTTFHHIIGM